MEAGTGEDSYYSNSSAQGQGFKNVEEAIKQAMERSHLLLDSSLDVIRIAELGCGSSSNAVTAASFVAQEIAELRKQNRCPPAQIHASFSDTTSNDFNTLFNILPQPQGDLYYFSGVPGSFFGRLFPRSSVHFIMTNLALHFLSKVPEALTDKTSEAWNKNLMMVDGSSPPAAIEAYARQADDDLRYFLRCRAQELKSGGILTMMFSSRLTQELPKVDFPFQNAWRELIKEGFLSQESLDSFNFPVYHRSADEVYAALQSFEREFEVVFETRSTLPPLNHHSWKAVSKGIIGEHIGNEKVVELMYNRSSEMAPEAIPLESKLSDVLVFSLLKK